MFAILNVVLPVFAIVALGYCAVRFRLFPSEGVRGLIAFVNNFATPCLLFQAMLRADFASAFNPAIIVPFYIGALSSLAIGTLLAIRLFRTRRGEGVSYGFAATFTNTVLIGLPIMQRAYGEEAMPVIFSIIGLHAPLLLTAGMLTMEFMRRDGQSLGRALAVGARRIATNPLLWGIGLGIAANLFGLQLIEPADAFVRMMAQAVLPTALFGLGGALNEYRLAQNIAPAAALTALKLVWHPLIAWVIMVPLLRVDPHVARYGVLLAAMPAGLNVYIFATHYDRGVSVAASTVLLSTLLSVVTVTAWLAFLGT